MTNGRRNYKLERLQEGEETVVKAMGNHSFYDSGKCGDLVIISKILEK